MTAPLDPRVAAAAEDADREALRARLTAASGNIRAAAVALLPDKTVPAAEQMVRRAIDRLGLRDWLRAAYPVSAVQKARRARERSEK